MSFTNIRTNGLLTAAIGIAVAGTVEASAQTSLSGVWAFTVTTERGVTYPEVMLEQVGEEITGDYSSDALGKSPVLGHLWGSEMRLSFSANIEGRPAQVIYLGIVEEDGTITGTIDIGGGRLMGTFTADRSPRWAGPR